MSLIDDIAAKLTQEFVDDTIDRIARMQVALTNIGAKDGSIRDALMSLSREVHNVKGSASNFGFATVGMVAERFEDFMGATADEAKLPVVEYQRFVDVMGDLIDMGKDCGPERAGDILRSLPLHQEFDPESVTANPGRALVVVRARTMGHMLARELANCGFRTQLSRDPFDATRMAAIEQPDLVLTSAVLDGMSGADLVRVLNAMRGTQKITAAVVTSFDRGHAELADLPDTVDVVRLGKTLSDDLAQVLTNVGEIKRV